MHFYKAFGITITSDLPMKELLSGKADCSADLLIRQGDVPLSLNATSAITSPFLQGNPNQLLIIIEGVGRFLVQYGREIIYSRHEGIDDDSLRLFLLGTCMGAMLQQRGYVVLHGNAISVDGKSCTIFVGHRGAGKSTTAAHYFQQGAYILADDVSAITFDSEGQPVVVPSFPQIKLWQDSADLLGISTEGLRRIRPQDMKFSYRIDERFCEQPLPLKRVIEIETADYVEMNGVEKLKRLICHSYRYHFLQHMLLSNQYAKLLLQLISKIHVEMIQRSDIPKAFNI